MLYSRPPLPVLCSVRIMTLPEDPMEVEQARQSRLEFAELFGGVPAGTAPPKCGATDTPSSPGSRDTQRGKVKIMGGISGSRARNGRRKALPDPSTRALLRTMTKLMLRHEAELARLRPSTTWMAFMDTQEEGVLATLQRTAVKWQEKFDAQQVDTSLKVFMFMALVKEASRRLEEMTQNEDQLARASGGSCRAAGSSPNWVYQQWNPTTRTVERAKRQDAIRHLGTLLQLGSHPGVVTAFKALRDLQAQHTAEVVPFMICLSLGQKSQMVKDLERQYLALPYTDWTARAATWAQRERSSKTEWK